MMRVVGEKKKVRELKELARKLLYDEVVVYAPRISWQPVHNIDVKNNSIDLVYKFKGENAWKEAHEFIDKLKDRGIEAEIDYDSSESDKVFVVVEVPIDEDLQVHEIDYDRWFEEL